MRSSAYFLPTDFRGEIDRSVAVTMSTCSTTHSGEAAGSDSSTMTSSATPLYLTPRERVDERRLIDHAPAR
jgi:hypothetical protein